MGSGGGNEKRKRNRELAAYLLVVVEADLPDGHGAVFL